MLSAQSYSFTQNTRLAISLSWIGGYTNVVTFLTCGHVVSHMTGNTTIVGLSVAQGQWIDVRYFAFAILMFIVGAMTSAIITETTRRRGMLSNYILPMALEAVLLGLFGLTMRLVPDLSEAAEWVMYWITALACLAMGLQNATITKISGAVVRTTHVTGVLTDLGLESVQLMLWYRDRVRGRALVRAGRAWRVSQRHPTFQRVALLASIFGSFVFGAGAGGWLFHQWPAYTMVPPISFLLWIILVDYFKPIAAVQQLDALGDPELRIAGILKAMLPPELGIYRLLCHRGNREHRAPNFQIWCDLLPAHWKVVVLALSPMTRLDEDAIMDLQRAAQRLIAQKRRLVISGVTAKQFRAMQAVGAVETFGYENLCPDIEFAVARGIDLLSENTPTKTTATAETKA